MGVDGLSFELFVHGLLFMRSELVLFRDGSHMFTWSFWNCLFFSSNLAVICWHFSLSNSKSFVTAVDWHECSRSMLIRERERLHTRYLVLLRCQWIVIRFDHVCRYQPQSYTFNDMIQVSSGNIKLVFEHLVFLLDALLYRSPECNLLRCLVFVECNCSHANVENDFRLESSQHRLDGMVRGASFRSLCSDTTDLYSSVGFSCIKMMSSLAAL